MSDTITADERDFIRNHLEDLPFIDDGPLLVVRLLNALEQAEARALSWTHEPPKVAGWYWRKETAKDRTHVFHFTGNWEDYGEYWESDRVCPLPLKLNGNLWAGPIPTPLELEES